jgi:hypothetical protein
MNEKPEIFFWKDGRKQGPISLMALDGAVNMGGLSPDTPAWTGKDREWKTASAVLRQYSQYLRDEASIGPAMAAKVSPAPAREAKAPPKSPQWIGVGLAVIFGLPLFLLFTHLKRGEKARDGEPGREASVSAVRSASSLTEAEQCVLMLRTDDGGAASAFIAMDGEKAYIYTNVHAASAKDVVFTDFRGNPFEVGSSAEVVCSIGLSGNETGIDLVRFPVTVTPALALTFATRGLIEQKPAVWTIGDSDGQSILRTLSGRMMGVGPYKIEVDCEFIQGNSGGPIVTADGKVVGIASYMTSNQSIWAKGTEQEVRRFGWIPGNTYSWRETTTGELAEEGLIVNDCMITSDLLFVISRLEITDTGLHVPKDFPEEVIDFMSLAATHPLLMGIEQTSRSVLASSGNGSPAKLTSLREYLRFFRSCAKYQESRLDSATKIIKSAYWKNEIHQNLEYHREALEKFKSQLRRYEELGGTSKTLADA